MFEADAHTESEGVSQGVPFEAVVTAVHHRWILLDHTKFHPATPERQSDTGLIDGIEVVSVEEGCDGVYHRVNDPQATQGLAMGQQVRAWVDVARRCRLMRLHSLQHLLLLGFQSRHGRASRVGGTVTDAGTTLDLDVHGDVEPDLDDIRAWVERVIGDDLVISSLARPPDRRRRFWHVDGVGTVACEARHPARTGEIGRFGLTVKQSSNAELQLSAALLEV